jgi:predicted transcriptional regulator
VLEPLGVDPLGDAVYLALVEMRHADVATLAAVVDAPPADVGAAIASLHRLDLVEPVSDGDWRARDPKVALDEAVLREQRMLQQRRDEIDRLHADVADLVSQLNRRDAGPGVVDIVSDPLEAARRCTDIVSHASDEILAFDGSSYSGAGRAVQDSNDALEAELLGRGVRVRGLYESASLDDPEQFQAVQRLVALGEQARVLPSLPSKLLVVDRQHSIIPLDPRSARLGTMFVHPSALLVALTALFEALWARATDVVPAREGNGNGDGLLLAMLATGCKDETIARQLRVSQSTVTRRVARLLETLDASSRFQAGVQAARRDLV